MNYFTLPFLICLLFFGCSSDETKTENPQQSNINDSEPKILYTAPAAATVKWTAFKHSKKVPVNGQFDSIFLLDLTIVALFLMPLKELLLSFLLPQQTPTIKAETIK